MKNNIFLINDIRRNIFSYLGKEPKVICSLCNCVLIWDKKVQNYFIIKNKNFYLKLINDGNYCLPCYYDNVNYGCNIN